MNKRIYVIYYWDDYSIELDGKAFVSEVEAASYCRGKPSHYQYMEVELIDE